MCGRYASFLPPEAIAKMFGTVNPLPNLRPTWNMAPTMDAPVIRLHPETDERHLDALRWGLVPSFTKEAKAARRPINARSETVASNGMFKAGFARRRCILPADAFYEWRANPAGKEPFAIARADGAPLAFAGLWEGWRDPDGQVLRTFAILTTSANGTMMPLHERMPVILEQGDWTAWLAQDPEAAAKLMRPAAEGVVRCWPVGREVGNVRNDGPHLLVPHETPDHADCADPPGSNPS